MKKYLFDILAIALFLIFSVVPLFYAMPVAHERVSQSAAQGDDNQDESQSSAQIVYDDNFKKYSPYDAVGDTTVLDNSAFLGNSHAQALENYGLLPNSDFYTKVGLSVLHVIKTSDGSSPVINGLYNKKYDRVFFMFGENELGWPYPENFIKEYEKIIKMARQILPDADLYIQSIFPVSLEVSQKNPNDINNKRIAYYNGLLEELATRYDKVYFINPAQAVRDKSGNLPSDASTDGMHFSIGYCKIWANYLIDHAEACKFSEESDSAYSTDDTASQNETTTVRSLLNTETTTQPVTEPESVSAAASQSETVTIVYYETTSALTERALISESATDIS